MTLALPWPVLADRVVCRDGGSFDFAGNTADDQIVSVFTLGVLGIGGLVDVVAWDAANGWTWLWLRRGFALGEQQIFLPLVDDEPLPIWRSPLDWLRAARKGLVVLRPEVALRIWSGYLDHRGQRQKYSCRSKKSCTRRKGGISTIFLWALHRESRSTQHDHQKREPNRHSHRWCYRNTG
jgi:hypothetical protein